MKLTPAWIIAEIWAGLIGLDFVVANWWPEHLCLIVPLSIIFGFILTVIVLRLSRDQGLRGP